MPATATQASLLHDLIQLAERRLARAQDAPDKPKNADEIDLLQRDVLNARLALAVYLAKKKPKGVV